MKLRITQLTAATGAHQVRGSGVAEASRNVGSFDCPRFLMLEGAVDGEDPLTGRYEFIVAHRVPNEPGAPPAAYGGSGLVIDVASTAWRGRPAGASCGSRASRGGCARNGPDRTCESAYCGADGTCAAQKPTCGLGSRWFLGRRMTSAVNCAKRAGSRRRSTVTATARARPDSTARRARSARDAPCPRSGDVFCPPGVDRPRPVAAGFYALYDGALPVGEAACPRGSYCAAGKRLPCPAGTYGNVSALSTSGCSAACGGAGEYCPEGSLVPLKCPPGSFCTGGAAPAANPCPPGTFGQTAGVRRRALQRAVSARVVLSRWLCVTDGLSAGNVWRIPTAQGRGMHGALSRGPLLSCEQHLRPCRAKARWRRPKVSPGGRSARLAGSPASDTSRLLRHGRRGRRPVAGSAVRVGLPLPPRRAARVCTGDTRTCDGRGGDPGRRGAVQALSSRSLLSAGDGRRETVPRGNLWERHWQRDWTRRRRVLGTVLSRPLLPGRLRAADSVSRWNVWEPDGSHDGGVLGGLLPGLDRGVFSVAMRGGVLLPRRLDAREGARVRRGHVLPARVRRSRPTRRGHGRRRGRRRRRDRGQAGCEVLRAPTACVRRVARRRGGSWARRITLWRGFLCKNASVIKYSSRSVCVSWPWTVSD